MSMSMKCLLMALAVGSFGAGASAAPVQECALDELLRASGAASRTPTVLAAWKLKYPTSTIPSRMATMVGLECYTCHDPNGFGSNCYRRDLLDLIQGGSTIADALDALDGVDSDGDGYANGVEATMQRHDSADIGYNMGLVGDTGTNPCGLTPLASITGVSETPPDPIPTVSQWGLLVMCLLVLTAGASILIRRPRHASA